MSRKPGWTRVAFGDVVRQVKDRVDPEESGLERYVAGEHMDRDDLRIRRWGTIGDGYLGPAFHMRFKPGQILYGSRRTYLRKVAVADFEGITANTTFVLEPKDPCVLLPELLPFLMQTEAFHEHAIKQSKGSVNPYINFSDLTWFEFTLPPIDEQRRITVALKEMDALCESQRAVALAAARLHAAQLAWLEQSEATKRVSLEALLNNIVPGKSVSGASVPPTRGQYGVLKVSAVDPQGFVPSESKRLLRDEDFVSEFSVRGGDLIMTRANTPELVGEVCLVDRDYPTLMLCDKTLRLEPKESIDRYVLWEMLQTDSVRQQLMAVATGTGRSMKNISQDKIRGLVIAYPSGPGTPELADRLRMSRRAIEQARGRQHDANRFRQTARATLLAGEGIA